MHTWHWHTSEGLSYLRCSLLAPWSHGFFTQQAWPHTPDVLVTALHHRAKAYRIRQVHGNTVLKADESWRHLPHADLPPGDAIISHTSDQAVWVCSADCTPVLIADARTGHVSAIHSGWRGTAAKIVPAAIAHLQEHGSQLADLRIAMGPAISGDVYQVSADVAIQVGASLQPMVSTTEPTPAAIATDLTNLQQLPDSPIRPDPEPGKVRLDVRRVIALQLEQLGITPEQVAIAPHCTYQQPDHFFSYRRDGLKKVQWSGIVSQ